MEGKKEKASDIAWDPFQGKESLFTRKGRPQNV